MLLNARSSAFVVAATAALALVITACGSDPVIPPTSTPLVLPTDGPTPTAGRATPTPTGASGDPAAGRQVFLTAGCVACHTIDGISSGMIGPNLTTVASVAGTREPGVSAADYIGKSIETPGAFVVDGFSNLMPLGLASGQQLDDLVAFLLTQS